MYQIIIKGLKIFAYHGVNPEEKINGQDFIVDAIIDIKKNNSFISDNIDDTVSYAKIMKSIIKVMSSNRFDLLEKCAETIAKYLILNYNNILNTEITVKKPNAPISADFEYVAVKISRNRDDYIE